MSERPYWKVPIREGCFLVGHRDPDSLLHCNTYLRSFAPGSHRSAHWCIDPGSQLDFAHVRQHLIDHVGGLHEIRAFSINHQDPDVVGNLPALARENDKLVGLATQDVWRLVRHLGVRPHHLYFAEQAPRGEVRFPGGHPVQAVPTPFCHFRGAMAFYDPESRILFSGDLFGGMSEPGRTHVYGEEADWAGIAQFHQIYMPTGGAVAHAVRLVRALRPRVEVIAPQHGYVLQGGFMESVLGRLESLPVGMDLMHAEMEDRFLPGYRAVVRDLVEAAARQIGWLEVAMRLGDLPAGHELRDYVSVTGTTPTLERHGLRALPLLLRALAHDLPRPVRAAMKSGILTSCTRLGLPLPQIGIGVEEAGAGSADPAS